MPETKYTTTRGASIAYQVLGDGPTDLVFAGGLVTHLDLQWDFPEAERYLRRLASFCRLILFDRRGTGLSDPVAGDHSGSPEDWAEDLTAVLDAVDASPAAIFAERDAGPAAILFAAAHPARVSALVLANTTARYLRAEDHPSGEPPESAEMTHEAILKGWGNEELVKTTLPSHANDANFLRQATRLQRAANTPRTAAAQYRVYLDSDVRSSLPKVRCPTLLLHRQNLPFFSAAAHSEYLEQHIAQSKRVEVAGTDLFFFYEGANESLGQIEEFLTGARAQSAADRVLATVLFADIADSTKLASKQGDANWRDVATRFQSMLRSQVARFWGRLVDTAGDGAFAVFDSPTRAVECARAIRDESGTLDLQVRIGLHAGECEIGDQAVRGVAVHIGARVAENARPGEILVSRTLRDVVSGSGLEFDRRGRHVLKGVPGKWTLYALVEADE